MKMMNRLGGGGGGKTSAFHCIGRLLGEIYYCRD